MPINDLELPCHATSRRQPALREHDEAGRPTGWTHQPVKFALDADEGMPGLIGSLEMALKDAAILDYEPKTEGTKA
jgi:hypothetical protein